MSPNVVPNLPAIAETPHKDAAPAETPAPPENIEALFAALDTVLSLHYSTSVTPARVDDVCKRATLLTRRRVLPATLEAVLAVFPDAYAITLEGKGYEYAMAPPGVTPTRFGALLPARRKEFAARLASLACFTPVPLSAVATNAAGPRDDREGRRRVPPKSALLAKDLSNLRRVLRLKQPSLELSLLERIKAKERLQQSLKQANAPEIAYDTYIQSKLPAAYEVLYELSRQNGAGTGADFKSFPVGKVVSILRDSAAMAVAENEALDTLRRLAACLPEKVQMLRRGGVHALKVYQLDREQDLAAIGRP